MRSTPFDVAIVGAGPTGSSLALALDQAGLDVALIDARDRTMPAQEDGRNFAVVSGSWHLLGRLGVAAGLSGRTQPLRGLEARDGARHWLNAPACTFMASDLGDTSEGAVLGHMIEAPILQAELDHAVDRADRIEVFAPHRFSGFDPGTAAIKIFLEAHEPVTARLLVGADGVNSPVRNAAGIGCEGRDYGKSVLAANVALSRPHEGIARQIFMPEGPFATLPLRGDRANLAWYMKRGAAEALAKLPVEAVTAELNHRFADFAGEMQIEGRVGSYPLILQIAREMTAPRVALVGDACRRVNPLAGQGLNQGFLDVAVLAETLEDMMKAGLDFGGDASLETYQTARRLEANSAALGLDVIDRLFSNDLMAAKPARGLGLLAAQSIPALRKAMAERASLAGDGLPRLMQPAF